MPLHGGVKLRVKLFMRKVFLVFFCYIQAQKQIDPSVITS